jgi:hypothetical protein
MRAGRRPRGRNHPAPMHRVSALIAASALCLAALPAQATERRFAFTYETTTTPKGAFEFENQITWKHIGVPGDGHTDLFQFRHEFEYGVTDRFQLALYVFNWQYNRRDEEGHRARWEHSGLEMIYRMTEPTSWLGSALYLEAVAGETSFELEGKLLLERTFGNWHVAYNLILEAEWEGERFGRYDERNGEFAHSLGITYDVNKHLSIGAEVLHEIPIPDWSETEESNVFVGPNASLRIGRFFFTATGLFQVSNVEGEPDAQVRVITGFDF